jgi:2-polyprenyl-6-hydroxyphenyl methylase/3-demethylubiquinone-9 3-methyltransferase
MRLTSGADRGTAPCKICGKASPVYGSVDFNKCCEEVRGLYLEKAGVQIAYRRCPSCQFLFSNCFDDWSPAEFSEHIYNDGYAAIDPDYLSFRPLSNARGVGQLLAPHKATLSLLDYGGGNGQFTAFLRARGFRAATYDPLVPAHAERPVARFDVITCFETLEHTPDPRGSAADLASFLSPGGAVIFSTLTQPEDFDQVGLGWWYVGPRNGHISIHSETSVRVMWASLGFAVVTWQQHVALALRGTVPAWVAQPEPAAASALTPA